MTKKKKAFGYEIFNTSFVKITSNAFKCTLTHLRYIYKWQKKSKIAHAPEYS